MQKNTIKKHLKNSYEKSMVDDLSLNRLYHLLIISKKKRLVMKELINYFKNGSILDVIIGVVVIAVIIRVLYEIIFKKD